MVLIYLIQFSVILHLEIAYQDIRRIPTVLENMKMSGNVILRPVKDLKSHGIVGLCLEGVGTLCSC